MSKTRSALAQVRETLRPDWYRSPVAPDRLRALNVRSDARGWLQAGGHLALFIATGLASYWLWLGGHWLALLVAVWCHGTVASFYSGVAPHELGHGTVFRTRWLNKAFCHLFSLLSWWDPYDYAASHTYHHRYTTWPEADRENVLPIEPSLRPALLLELFTLNLTSPPGRNFGKGGLLWTVYLTARRALRLPPGHTHIESQAWLADLHEAHRAQYAKSVVWSRWLLGFHGAVLLLAIATGQWLLPVLLTLPAFIGNWARYFVGLPQHCGLRENVPDFRKNTRSMTLNPLLEFLYWHMNWHTEHHMYAAVPCYRLKALAREIASDMPAPRTLTGAWREMRDTWRRQQEDPGYAFDTPVPPPAAPAPAAMDDALAASIGELAPESPAVTGQVARACCEKKEAPVGTSGYSIS